MPTPTWDLTDQDCDAFDLNWAKTEFGTATITLVNYDGRNCYKFTSPQDGSLNYAYANNTALTDWTQCSAEFVFRQDSMSYGGYYKIAMYLRDKDKYPYGIYLYHDTTYTSNIYVMMRAGDTYLRQWVDVSSSEWHTARLVISSSYILWAFLDGQFLGKLVLSGGPATGYSANTIGCQAYGVLVPPGSGTREIWVDHIRMSSSKSEPDYCGIAKIQGASINTRYYSVGNEGLMSYANPADSIRYTLENRPVGTATYAFPVVDTTDSLASKIRVKTSAGIKALQKYPTSF